MGGNWERVDFGDDHSDGNQMSLKKKGHNNQMDDKSSKSIGDFVVVVGSKKVDRIVEGAVHED